MKRLYKYDIAVSDVCEVAAASAFLMGLRASSAMGAGWCVA